LEVLPHKNRYRVHLEGQLMLQHLIKDVEERAEQDALKNYELDLENAVAELFQLFFVGIAGVQHIPPISAPDIMDV
jgi:hypothetical protein